MTSFKGFINIQIIINNSGTRNEDSIVKFYGKNKIGRYQFSTYANSNNVVKDDANGASSKSFWKIAENAVYKFVSDPRVPDYLVKTAQALYFLVTNKSPPN